MMEIYGNSFKMSMGVPSFLPPNNYGLLNIDWFKAFEHSTYSVGVIFLVLKLSRSVRFKREIVLFGIMPGPSEPTLTVNSYLFHLYPSFLIYEVVCYSTFLVLIPRLHSGVPYWVSVVIYRQVEKLVVLPVILPILVVLGATITSFQGVAKLIMAEILTTVHGGRKLMNNTVLM